MKSWLTRRVIAVCLVLEGLSSAIPAVAKSNPAGDVNPAPISCTSDVPPNQCQQVRTAFEPLQSIPFVSQIEVVIADPAAFAKEKDRLAAQHDSQVKAALDSKVSGDELVRVVNRKPSAPIALSDSILIILDESRGIRVIRRVVVSTDLFRDLDLKSGKTTVDNDKAVHFSHGPFSASLAESWSKYIAGYIEGWNWGRFEAMSQ
jgi:hypothetical protein